MCNGSKCKSLLNDVFRRDLYDKVHRCIRDIRLATEHAAGGAIHRALLHMTFIWQLNGKPFGSGTWYRPLFERLADGPTAFHGLFAP